MFDFPTDIPDLDAVPAEYQPLYEEGDGSYSLLPALAARMENPNSDADRQSLKDEHLALTGELEAYRAISSEPGLLAKKVGDWEQAIDESRVLLEQKDRDLSDLLQASDGYMVASAASLAISDAKGSVPLLLPHLQSVLTVVEEDGKRIIEVTEKAGARRLRENGDAFSVTDLVAEMKGSSLFARAFDSDDITGGGMASSGDTSRQTNISRYDQSALNNRLEEIAAGKISVS